MFDDQTKEPEDIFAGSEAPATGNLVQPSAPNQAQKPAPTAAPTPEDVVTSGPNRTFVILIVAIIVLLVVVIGALAYTWMNRSASTVLPQPVTQQQPTTNVPTTPLPTVPEATTPTPEPSAPVDTDKDGLTDAEEATLGTNPTLADSDEDGLSDADEVRVWKTDPLDSDSDNDGYPDGAEVKAGYDPNVVGGKLLNLPPADSSTSAPSTNS